MSLFAVFCCCCVRVCAHKKRSGTSLLFTRMHARRDEQKISSYTEMKVIDIAA